MHSSIFNRTYTIFSLKGCAEVALVVVAQFDPDVGYRQTGIEEIMGGEVHAEIEEILEDGGSEFMLECLLKSALVGTDHRSNFVQGRHVLILRKNYVLGIVHLVANEQTVVFVSRSQTTWHKESRQAIDDFRFHIAM